MIRIEEYIPIVGQPIINDLKLIGEKLKNKSVQHINSTSVGGGVAEILNKMIPLMKGLGINTKWDVVKGGEKYFDVTKKFHNALHGKNEDITKDDFDLFMETSRKNMEEINDYSDIVFIHDPQPIALINKKLDNKWIWRCHVDVSKPNPNVWNFLMDFIPKYNAAVFSAPNFSKKNFPTRQFLITPSIDPLSDKNKELPQDVIDSVLIKHGILNDKPIITQISRFDRLKDPIGVIDAYLKVKKYIDCQLILAGGTAADDPEGIKVFEEVKEKAEKDKDIHILLLSHSDIEVNALQRATTIIIQKSIKEGFGLTVSEALWKSKPVVASNVGGIPLQITHKHSGLLCHSIEGAAFAIKQLVNNPEYAKKLGQNGREHIKNNFLITRHLKDYLLLFLSLYHPEDIVYL